MAIQISKIFHANVYFDGTNEQLGRASEVQLPKLETEDSEHKGVGMFGTLSLPSGLKELTAGFKWTGFYADVAKLAANPMKAHAIMVRCNYETHTSEGKVSEVPLVVHLKGRWKSWAPGTLKPMSAADGYDDTLTLTYYKMVLDGTTLYEIDVMNNVWIVDGVDLLATMRANLGA